MLGKSDDQRMSTGREKKKYEDKEFQSQWDEGMKTKHEDVIFN